MHSVVNLLAPPSSPIPGSWQPSPSSYPARELRAQASLPYGSARPDGDRTLAPIGRGPSWLEVMPTGRSDDHKAVIAAGEGPVRAAPRMARERAGGCHLGRSTHRQPISIGTSRAASPSLVGELAQGGVDDPVGTVLLEDRPDTGFSPLGQTAR